MGFAEGNVTLIKIGFLPGFRLLCNRECVCQTAAEGFESCACITWWPDWGPYCASTEVPTNITVITRYHRRRSNLHCLRTPSLRCHDQGTLQQIRCFDDS